MLLTEPDNDRIASEVQYSPKTPDAWQRGLNADWQVEVARELTTERSPKIDSQRSEDHRRFPVRMLYIVARLDQPCSTAARVLFITLPSLEGLVVGADTANPRVVEEVKR